MLRHGHPEQFSQDHVLTFEYLQGGKLCSFSGQPLPVLDPPHSEKLFPNAHIEPPVFLCAIAAGPGIVNHWKKAWLCSLCIHISDMYSMLMRCVEPFFLQAGQSPLSQTLLTGEML